MSGWYELSKSSNDQFKFVLKAGNGEVILTSELYTGKSGAMNGIESVQANSPMKPDMSKKWRKTIKPYFNLKTANHQLIGTSQMYSSTAARDNGTKSVMENGKTITIKDLT